MKQVLDIEVLHELTLDITLCAAFMMDHIRYDEDIHPLHNVRAVEEFKKKERLLLKEAKKLVQELKEDFSKSYLYCSGQMSVYDPK